MIIDKPQSFILMALTFAIEFENDVMRSVRLNLGVLGWATSKSCVINRPCVFRIMKLCSHLYRLLIIKYIEVFTVFA